MASILPAFRPRGLRRVREPDLAPGALGAIHAVASLLMPGAAKHFTCNQGPAFMENALMTDRDRFVENHPEQRRVVNGRDWGVIRAGTKGPALVLIPGTLGRADIFWQQIAALKGQARILALSYPAKGGIAEWAGDIAGMIADDGLSEAVVLGSSLGGYLAQFVTAVHRDLVGGLVAANTLASARGIDQIPPYSLDLLSTPIEELRAGFQAGLTGWIEPGNPYASLAGLLLEEARGRIPEAELRARLQALKTAPVLPVQTLPRTRIFTVQSDDDHLISPQMRADLRDALQPVRAFRFRQASHFPYVTRPDAYVSLLREVLGLEQGDAAWPDGAETVCPA